MTTVTIPGTGGTTFGLAASFNNPANAALATSIANLLLAANTAGKLEIASISGGGTVLAPDTIHSVHELLIEGGGTYNVPAGWVVVDATSAPVTLNGTPSITVLGGGSQLTLNDPGEVVVGDFNSVTSGSADVLNLTAADTGAKAVGNNGNDTLSAAGGTQTITSGTGTNLLTATGNLDAIISNGAGDIVNADGTNGFVSVAGAGSKVFAGAAATTMLGGGKGDVYFLGSAGKQEFLNTGGSGTVFGGNSGLATVFGSFGVTPGADLVIGGTGDLILATGGSNDTVLGSGATTVFGSFGGTTGNDVIFGGNGAMEVATGASNDTIFAGTAAGQTVFGGFDSVAANDGNSIIHGGANALEVATGGSSDTVYAGTGNDTVFIGTGSTAGSNVIYGGGAGSGVRVQFVGGAGAATVFGGAGSSTMFGTAGSNMTYIGTQTGVQMDAVGPIGSGDTLNASASTTNNFLDAESGTVSLVGGSGDDTIVGGVTDSLVNVGNVTTLTGGLGNNLFFFAVGQVNGTDVITDFTASSGNNFVMAGYDSLTGGGADSAAKAAVAGAQFAGGNTTITLQDGTKVTFDNTTVAQLSSHISST
jgi:Ca2+-binding RTX toxin-like protein